MFFISEGFIYKAIVLFTVLTIIFLYLWRKKESFLNTEPDFNEMSDEELEKYRKKLFFYRQTFSSIVTERWLGIQETRIDYRVKKLEEKAEKEAEKRIRLGNSHPDYDD